MKIINTLALLMLFTLGVAAQQTQLHILHTSDMHSRIEPKEIHSKSKYAGMGGMVRRAALVKKYRSEHSNVLLVDCGDFSLGTPYYNLFRGELEVRMMNLMGYDAITIGNHEFDFGLDNMAHLFRLAEFPVVCANYDVAGTVLEGLVKPYVIIERGGLKIGIFGLSPQMDGLVQAAKCEGIIYKDPVAAAREVSDLLRKKEKCDVVICLSHLGYFESYPGMDADIKVISESRNIDAVLGGHSHTYMERPIFLQNAEGRNIPLLHSGKHGVFVGELTLTVK